jgi:hypothetical protein
MTLDEYLPYKTVRETFPIGLYGPTPFRPDDCGYGRFNINGCPCASIEKANLSIKCTEEYKAEQALAKRLRNIYSIWESQQEEFNREINSKTFKYKLQFIMLCDNESPIDCWDCEQKEYADCMCKCKNCNSKFCFRCD